MGRARQLGPYEITGLLGEGGMAVVYVARHPRLATECAIKMVTAGSAAARRRLAREARAQRRLSHPNVLPILDVLELSGRTALVLPRVEGPTLARLLGARRPSEAEAADLFRQIAAGVAAIHGSGLVHRDLKPSNILLDPAGERVRALVADFGLARSLSTESDESRITRTGAVVGTPAYMAPEQRISGAVDPRADLWALGAIGYEIVSGQRWSQGGDLGAAPAPWRSLLGRLLETDPDRRPADAAALAADLPPGDAGLPLLEACRALRPEPGPLSVVEPETWDFEDQGVPMVGLPEERGTFVGRDAELVELGGLLADGARVVTLVGLGGVGKTRLAVRYAAIFGSDWSGVWFVDLAGVRAPEEVVGRVASALDVPMDEAEPVASVGRAMALRGRMLLVLDGAEAVSGPVARLLEVWLARAPELSALATSLQRLDAPGERACAVGPLPLEDAREMLLDRADARTPRWGTDAGEREAVSLLASAAGGLPLAIEIVAASADRLAPAELLSRVDQLPGFDAALAAALERSWRLLPDPERSALTQLAAIEGPFALDAAEQLEIDDGWVLDALGSLLDRGLVTRAGEGRFEILPLVRSFARSFGAR